MKKLALATAAVAAALLAAPVTAQEHWTEGPVWEITYYRTKPGKFDEYLKYLRRTWLPQAVELKKAGVFLDYKVFVNPSPRTDKDWNVGFATLHSSFGKALDFNAETDAKEKAVAAKHYKTQDEEKQREMIAPRFDWREHVSTQYVREIVLKPLH